MTKPRANGNIITVGDQTLILRGANLINYNWKYPHNRSASQYRFDLEGLEALLTDWQGVAATLWVTSGPILRNESEYMDWLDRSVDIAENAGGYVILSFASDEPDRNTHPFLISNDGIDMFRQLAQRYRDRDAVLYATQAEPGEWTNSRSRWRELRDRQEETIDAIRSEDPDVLIGVSGTSWSQRVDWMVDDPVRRDNIFVKPHIYASMPGGFDSNGVWAAHNAGYPIVVGEFGTGGRMNNDDSRQLIRICEENNFGWQAWNFNNEGPPVLLRSKNPSNRTSYGNVVYDELQRTEQPSPPTPLPPPEPVELPFRVNVGGNEVLYEGRTWLDDQAWNDRVEYGYVNGSGRNGSANHTDAMIDDPEILATERWGLGAYRVRLPVGWYEVSLYFAETFDAITGPGQRVFQYAVGLNSTKEIDVYDTAGGRDIPIVTQEIVEVRDSDDGVLEITFTGVTELPALKAIEIQPYDEDEFPPDNGDDDEDDDDDNDERVEQLLKRIEELESTVAQLDTELAARDAHISKLSDIIQAIRDAVRED